VESESISVESVSSEEDEVILARVRDADLDKVWRCVERLFGVVLVILVFVVFA